ncbi:hypothetical protein A3G63_02500 [Candidatus Kaiserbacteria bacterium RIFCSPLOWO2_12_FULL_52_8]|uniref:Type 4 fimbrial biogenesis protein PilX N-terminal domain-containing protein n=1 Tax=Candidatus Kaiserbacteria bacterium RIFCSPHIGHO2_01_FULL_53_31 TaxID=1798481 RepID=A0A1F6CHQ9_9BACT|nr:MAG: hypothetical protein A2678_03120 [Candidatus Kaiserbacteria bacterium RIFCSPHIGHO2_01_FULL_53_31]OGG92544.1 MAG: hypothetical protein A3G63_02500 [Candidatus Kaiserbacteria bacterium RIFCSPLOWO2_12_FULL_52_8]
MMRNHEAYKRGYILLVVLVVSAVVIAITSGFFNYYGSAVYSERHAFASARALALAEAGIDKAVYELNQDADYSGESDTVLGAGSFSVSVASIDGNTKRLTVTGFAPNSANPIATKVVKATVSINSSVVSFRYGVQVGQGGVSMSNGSRIEGNLFSNGSVTGSGTISGDVTVAVSTDPIANQQWTVQNTGFKIGDIAAHADVAQSFKPSVSASLAGISLQLKKTGSPGDITIKIVNDIGSKPGSTVLASGVIPASLITSAYGFADVTLDASPTVTSGTTYWIIAIAAVSVNDYFMWGQDSGGGYSRGVAKYSSNWNAPSPSWNNITGDLDFRMFVNGIATTLSGITVGGDAWAHTLSSCTVGGDASYQTISNCDVTGTENPGTDPATPVPLPISEAQIAEWEATAEAGGTLPGPYSYEGTRTLGPVKIDGDLTVTNGASLILTGPVWVRGNVTFSNNAVLTVSQSTGNSGAVIIADATGNTNVKGIVNLSNNVIVSGNGEENSFPMILTTNTGSNAVELSNNAVGVILYAPYGSAEISNGTHATQVTAKSLELENNAVVSYDNGLQNASFSNGPGASWAVVSGTYAITQ